METKEDITTAPISRIQAQNIMFGGCPSRKEVRAADNAIYLGSKGKSGGLDLQKALGIVVQNKTWQDARRFLGIK
jgi:hypothetical protein